MCKHYSIICNSLGSRDIFREHILIWFLKEDWFIYQQISIVICFSSKVDNSFQDQATRNLSGYFYHFFFSFFKNFVYLYDYRITGQNICQNTYKYTYMHTYVSYTCVYIYINLYTLLRKICLETIDVQQLCICFIYFASLTHLNY